MIRTSCSVLFALLLSTGCAQIVGIEDTTLEEGSGGSGGLGPEWDCVGSQRPKPTGTSIELTAKVANLASGAALQNAEVAVCAQFTDCSVPAASAMTDAQGQAVIPINVSSSGFLGYFRISAAGFKTLYWYYSEPPVADFELPVQMIDDANLDGLLKVLQQPSDPTKGHLTFTARDCDGNFAANLKIEAKPADPGAATFYADSAGFVSDSIQPYTTAAGRGGIFNLSPNSIQLTATPKDSTSVVSSIGGVLIRAGTVSTIELGPSQK